MATDALARIVHQNGVMVRRDGTLWIFQSAPVSTVASELAYAYQAGLNQSTGTLHLKEDLPRLVKMHDMLVATIAPDMRQFTKAQWQKWWGREYRRANKAR